MSTSRPVGGRAKGQRLGQPRGSAPKEDRFDDVIEVATRLFCERGYRATRLDDIAQALGVTRAALYYYFEGKTDVLEEVCARAMASTETVLREVQALEDPADRLRAFTVQYARNMAGDAARVFARDNGELRPAFRRGLMARARSVNAGAEAIVAYGIERGAFTPGLDVRVTVLGYLGTFNALAEWHRPDRDGPLEDVTRRLVDVYIDGFATRDP